VLSFTRKTLKPLTPTLRQFYKNDVTVPMAMLLTGKRQFQQPIASLMTSFLNNNFYL